MEVVQGMFLTAVAVVAAIVVAGAEILIVDELDSRRGFQTAHGYTPTRL